MVVSPGAPDPPVDASPESPPSKRQRVPALAPHERRAALIVATIPLLQKHGIDISTRQIADAAGVAEGTIFGVFRDKASLIDAAVAAAFDPATVIRRLRDIDPGLDLRGRMTAAVQILREYIAEQGLLLHVVRSAAVKGERASSRVDVMAARYLILYELANLIEPDAARLRRNASTAARLLLSMAMAPRDGFGDLGALDSHEMVSLILDGLLVRDQEPGLDQLIHDRGDIPC
jgi:AcrR family transcriptional regulator